MSPIAKESSLPISNDERENSEHSTPVCNTKQSPTQNYSDSHDNLTPQELEEYFLLKQKQMEIENRLKEIEQKKLNSGKLYRCNFIFIDKASNNNRQTKLYELSQDYDNSELREQENINPNKIAYIGTKYNYKVDRNRNSGFGYELNAHNSEINSFSKLLKLSSELQSNSLECFKSSTENPSSTFNYLKTSPINSGASEKSDATPLSIRKSVNEESLLKSKTSKLESDQNNRSQRGLLYDFNNENLYIENFNMKDVDTMLKSADAGKSSRVLDMFNCKRLNNEIINIKIQDTSKDGQLFQINENELEQLESSTENLPNFLSDMKSDNSNRPKLS